MAKKPRKLLARYEKNQSGCIRNLISNIFDFPQGRSSQKLLQDKKRESKRITRVADPEAKLDSLSESCEICKEFNEAVQSETSTADAGQMSVKELMDDEMIGEQDKMEGSNSIRDVKQNAVSDAAHVKKNHRRARSMTSLILRADDLAATEGSVSKKPNHRRHKSLSSVYLNVMVEELCSQIDHKDGVMNKLIEDPSVIEEKLWDATRVLVNQFSDGKGVTKDGKIQASKELMDALQIIDSNKQVFLKLLQNPDSQLVKHLKSMQDVQVEEGRFKVVTDSNLLEQNVGNRKHTSFFWRRFKGLERNPSKKNDSSEDSKRIVVLKPGSLPESPLSMGEGQHQSDRVSSAFSFAEFRRKLKHVLRKERHGAFPNGMSDQHKEDQLNLAIRDKRVGGDSVPMASPSRDHFFIEKIPKSCVGFKNVKKGDKKEKLKDDALLLETERVSNIYAEAKRHLAEIISDNNMDEDMNSKQMPRSLGRLISFSGFTSPTLYSPRLEGERRISSETDENSSRVRQETDVTIQAPVEREPESELCQSSIDSPTYEPEFPTEVDIDIVRSPDDESRVENNQTESSICSEENWHSARLRQDSGSESEPSSSQITSTLLATEKNEDREMMSDATSKPSPVSVLEPLFTEDDITPPSLKSLSAFEPVQPRQIQFEEEIPEPSSQSPCRETRIEDHKYTLDFVKAVVEMSGLTWDELQRRTLFSDHLIYPSLLDEVDFLPDLLPCDFNLLFDLINEVLIEISWLNFGCMIPSSKPFVQPKLRDKDLFAEIWKGVEWYLKLEGLSRSLDQIVTKDLAKPGIWMNLRHDTETIGVQLQEAILEQLIEETLLSCVS